MPLLVLSPVRDALVPALVCELRELIYKYPIPRTFTKLAASLFVLSSEEYNLATRRNKSRASLGLNRVVSQLESSA